MIDNLVWLQKWYNEQCDGDWEHEFGIKIDTLDNPGWIIKIDLKYTDLENKFFEKVNWDKSEHNWIHCNVENAVFRGSGGPKNLSDIIRVFAIWAGLKVM